MSARVAVFTLLFLCVAGADSAQAMMFGRSEKIHEIQPIDDEFSLCHKLTIYYFVGGVYLKDEGYVAKERGISDTYIPLTPGMIEELQSERLLPKPLPDYSIPLVDYLAGFSLWLIVAGIALFALVASVFERIRGQKEGDHLRGEPGHNQYGSSGGACGVQLDLGEELPPLCALCGAEAKSFKARRFEATDGSDLGIASLVGSEFEDAGSHVYTFKLPLCWEHTKTPDALSQLQAVAHGPRSAILVGVDRDFAMAVQQKQSQYAQDIGDTMRPLDSE